MCRTSSAIEAQPHAPSAGPQGRASPSAPSPRTPAIHGGGHFGLLAGRAGAEAAAAAGVFGEEISGQRAVQLGLAWEALPSEQVEGAGRRTRPPAARDPQLARKATASLRTELGPPRLPWAAALEVERGAQLWSLRRRVSQ